MVHNLLDVRASDEELMTRSLSDVGESSDSSHLGFPSLSSVATSNVEEEKHDTFSVVFKVKHKQSEKSPARSFRVEWAFQLAWLLVLYQFRNHENDAVDVDEEGYVAHASSSMDMKYSLRLPSDVDFQVSCQDLWKSLVSSTETAMSKTGQSGNDFSLLRYMRSSSVGANAASFSRDSAGEEENQRYSVCLTMHVGEEETLAIAQQFTSSVDEDVFKAIVARFEATTNRILDDPDQSVVQALSVGPESQAQIQSHRPRAHTECIHWLVQQRAASQPDAQAIVAPDAKFTYAELDKASDNLTHLLFSLGVRRHATVALCFQKSALAVVAMLATLKAGGVCVPLDPAHPISQHQTILNKTEASLIITDATSHSAMESLPVQLLELSHELLASVTGDVGEGAMSINSNSQPSDAAWVIFTSGSTGTPKGIVLEHVNICSSALETGPVLGIDKSSRVFQFAAYTFDVSVEEIIFTLILGGCLCVPAEAERLSDLAASFERFQANWIDMTASVTRLIEPSEVPTLQTLNSGGELLGQDLIEKWSDHVTLKNTFGPAEGTVNSTCNPSVKIGTSSQDVGRPVGCYVWIVDSDDPNIILPVGAVGEIVLQGPTVAREYIGDPDKTAAHFLDNVEWSTPQSGRNWRFYRTGDLGRYCEDGTLLFLGRKDSQVKLHGLRIELDGIENCLLVHPDVHHAVCMVAREGPAREKLIAVINLEDDHPLMQASSQQEELGGQASDIEVIAYRNAFQQVTKIREHLEEKIPKSHVPTIYCFARKLPMTTSVKINRPVVRGWVHSWDDLTYASFCETPQSTSAAVPATETEEVLQVAAAHVLNRPREMLPLDAPFLSMGGDSITAMQMVSRSRGMGVQITVHGLLSCASLSQLAKTTSLRATASQRYQPVSTSESFDLSPVQKTHFELEPFGKDRFSLGFNVITRKCIQRCDLERAIATVTQRHSMLRARFFQDRSGQWRQKINPGSENDFSLEWRRSEDCANVTGFLSSGPGRLNLRTGPLFAATVCERSDGMLDIAFTAHHLVVDLVSWRVLLEDLETLLNGQQLDNDYVLSFETWCALQTDHVANFLSPESALPFYVPSAPYSYWGMADRQNDYDDVLVEEFILDEDVVAQLLTSSNVVVGSEPIDILLAALHFSFKNSFKDRGPPQVFNEGHGRQSWDESLDLSRTIGWFTILAPVCVELPQESTPLEYLEEVMRVRRRTPANGWEYFATRYLHKETNQAIYQDHLPMEILFNFMGSFQQLDRSDALFQTPDIKIAEPFTEIQTGKRDNLFETAIMINGGQAMCRLEYNRHMLHQDRIRSWWNYFRETITSLSTQLAIGAAKHSASQYPLLALQPKGFHELERTILSTSSAKGLNEIEDIYPCTQMQVGILLSQAQDPRLYSVHTIWELSLSSSKPDPLALLSAWNDVVQYQPMLRTVFVENGNLEAPFYQAVLKAVRPDARILHIQKEQQDLETFLQRMAPPEYKLGNMCHRLTLASSSDGRVSIRIDLSHAIIDGYSMTIIMQNLEAAYFRRLDMTKKPCFSGFVGHLSRQRPETDLAYWKHRLETAEPCIIAPILENGASPSALGKPDRLIVRLDLEISDIASFCHSHSVTTFNVIQAAWALLLKAYTMSDDVSFGYLVSDRDLPLDRLDEVVGPFIAMLVQRVALVKTSTLLNLTKSVQQDVLSGLEHRHASLADLHHALDHKPRSLFNTILSYQKEMIHSNADHQGQILQFREVESVDPAEYDLSVGIKETASVLEISISYWSSCMGPDQAQTMIHAFRNAIGTITNEPTKLCGETSLVGSSDLQRLESWNGNVKPAAQVCLHDLIERQVDRAPHAPAIEAWDSNFTYAELDKISNQLAYHLTAQDVRCGDRLALCFSKSAWATIASIAVLKAGATCVQLDPEWQEDRRQKILDRTKAKVVLVGADYPRLFDKGDHLVFEVSEGASSSWPAGQKRPRATVTAAGAAFILFTSGSTGEPKGAVISHSAMASSSLAHGPVQDVNSNSRVYQFAAYTFDVAAADTFTTLIHGGCICVPSDFDRLNNLTNSVRALRANWIHVTPTVSRLLNPSDVPELKTIVIGGEALSRDIIDRYANKCNLINTYGPAECSVTSACHTRIQPDSSTAIIGKPVGTRIWIVDPSNHHNLLPFGAIGEILIEGPNLAEGYLGDRIQTAATFVQDVAWAGSASRRFYKSGDLGSWTSQGSLVFSRRKDTTVKLRGIKVELGDVESAVKHFLPTSYIVAAELTKIGASSIENRLIAFVSGSEVSRISANDLRRQVGTVLQSHMMPTVIFAIEQMPMTASRKIDRKVLRAIASELTEARIASSTTRTPTRARELTEAENRMAVLWENVLKLPTGSVNCDDCFLDLGGDSLSAMKLVALARNAHMDLSVASILRRQQLSELCSSVYAIENAPGVTQMKSLEPFALIDGSFSQKVGLRAEVAAALGVSPDDVEDAYPVTGLQESIMASSARQPGAFILQETLELPSTIDLKRLELAWIQMVNHITILRSRTVTTAVHGMIQAIIRNAAGWGEVECSLESFLKRDVKELMNPGNPLSRATVVHDHVSGKLYMVWTISHALYDGQSRSMIWEALDRAFNGQRLVPNPPYAEYVAYLKSVPVPKAEHFWRTRLHDAAPVQFPRRSVIESAASTPSSQEIIIPFERKDSQFLPSTVLQGAWAMMLAEYTGSSDVTFGVTMSDRSAPISNIDKMIGPLVALVPSRTTVEQLATVDEYLTKIQTHTLEAMEYQHLGLQDIRRLSASAENACDFNNIMNIFNVPDEVTSAHSYFVNLSRVPNPLLNFDTFPLVLDCTLGSKQITVTARFDTAFVSNIQATRLLNQLHDRVQNVSGLAASMRLADVQLTSAQDRDEFLSNCAATVNVPGPVHLIVENQLQDRPFDSAIVSNEGNLSNKNLNILSNKLACYLISSGVQPGSCIPLVFEKSIWTIVAQLAVFKLGCFFVPFDPSHPLARLEDIVREVGASYAVCSKKNERLCRALGLQATTAFEASEWISANVEVEKWQSYQSNSEDPAYVLFTSGSTGKPKGVVVSHQAFCSSLASHGKILGLSRKTRMLQFCAYTFDVSLGEIWGTLIHGGCVCVPSEEGRSLLARTINDFAVNTALLTPTLAREFKPEDVPTLKTMTVGGEQMREDTIGLWSDKVNLINGYGPTEATILSIMQPHANEPYIIGKPVGCNCWIVNPENHDVLSAHGTMGELLIEGPILANGYLNDANKTAASFITNPKWTFSQDSRAPRRFYKTGDLVQYTDEASFRYIGRKQSDGQVKLRGLRIELGEVEHHLNAHPLVHQAVTVSTSKGLCKDKLVGVIALQDLIESPSPPALELIDDIEGNYTTSVTEVLNMALSSSLPYYMVPSVWCFVKRMPQLTSGKTDRRSVTRWIEDVDETDFAAITNVRASNLTSTEPETETERKLQAVWADVLGYAVRSVTVDQSFTALGGDSIRAVRLVAKCTQIGVKISMLDILRTPSIKALAKQLEKEGYDGGTSSTVISSRGSSNPLQPQPSRDREQQLLDAARAQGFDPLNIEDIAGCSVLKHDMLESQKDLPGSNCVYTTSQIRSRDNQAFDTARLVSAWNQVVNRHVSLRTIFLEMTDDKQTTFFQVILKSLPPSIDLRSSPRTGDINTTSDARALNFGLGQPQHKVTIWSTHEPNTIVFRLEINHAIFDGVSWAVIVNELQSIYSGESPQEMVSTSSKRKSFGCCSDEGDRYWSTYLSGLQPCNLPPSAPPIPSTIPTPTQRLAQWASSKSSFRLDELTTLCRSIGITLPNLIQGAWALTLSELTGQDDVCFGYLVSNRVKTDGSYDAETVGCGIDMLIQRSGFPEGSKIKDLLLKVRDDCAEQASKQHDSEILSYHTRTEGGTRRFNTLVNMRVFARQADDQTEKKIGEGWQVDSIGEQDSWDFALVLHVEISDNQEELEIEFSYQTWMLSGENVEAVRRRFKAVLESIVIG